MAIFINILQQFQFSGLLFNNSVGYLAFSPRLSQTHQQESMLAWLDEAALS
jgi:hypothetical protein